MLPLIAHRKETDQSEQHGNHVPPYPTLNTQSNLRYKPDPKYGCIESVSTYGREVQERCHAQVAGLEGAETGVGEEGCIAIAGAVAS